MDGLQGLSETPDIHAKLFCTCTFFLGKGGMF